MIRNSEALRREDDRISLISMGGTAMQHDYVTITERELPLNTIGQSWIFEVGEEARVGRTTPRLLDTLVRIMRWLSHLGSARIDDSRLESRHNIDHNFRINSIGR